MGLLRIHNRSGAAVLALAAALASTSATMGTSLPIIRQFSAPATGAEGMTFVNGDLWVWCVDEPDLFYVLDPEDGTVLASYPTPATGGAAGLAYDGQYLWGVLGGTGNDFLGKFDPSDGSLIQSFTPPIPSPTGITYDGENLWISQTDDYQLAKVDPNTLQTIETITKEPWITYDLAWDGRTLWLAAFVRNVGGFLHQIDPVTGQTLHIFDPPGSIAGGLVASGDCLYVADAVQNTIYVLAIPEPAPCWGMIVGCLAIVRQARRKRGQGTSSRE